MLARITGFSITCTVALVLGACHAAVKPEGEETTLEGYVVVHEPTILFYATKEEATAEEWDSCANVTSTEEVLAEAARLQHQRVRIRAVNLGWPFISQPPGGYTRTYIKGRPVVQWCVNPPLYWADTITLVAESADD